MDQFRLKEIKAEDFPFVQVMGGTVFCVETEKLLPQLKEEDFYIFACSDLYASVRDPQTGQGGIMPMYSDEEVRSKGVVLINKVTGGQILFLPDKCSITGALRQAITGIITPMGPLPKVSNVLDFKTKR